MLVTSWSQITLPYSGFLGDNYYSLVQIILLCHDIRKIFLFLAFTSAYVWISYRMQELKKNMASHADGCCWLDDFGWSARMENVSGEQKRPWCCRFSWHGLNGQWWKHVQGEELKQRESIQGEEKQRDMYRRRTNLKFERRSSKYEKTSAITSKDLHVTPFLVVWSGDLVKKRLCACVYI